MTSIQHYQEKKGLNFLRTVDAIFLEIKSTFFLFRKYLRAQFADAVSIAMQENGMTCRLTATGPSFNWVSSSVNANPFWRGVYSCVSCGKIFEASIECYAVPYLKISIAWTGEINHIEK